MNFAIYVKAALIWCLTLLNARGEVSVDELKEGLGCPANDNTPLSIAQYGLVSTWKFDTFFINFWDLKLAKHFSSQTFIF